MPLKNLINGMPNKGVTMPQYDFKHPTFKHGFVEFPIKKEPIFETFCKVGVAHRQDL